MNKIMCLGLLFICSFLAFTAAAQQKQKYVMVIHGGAGTILKKNMTPEKEQAYLGKLREALQAGYDQIKAGNQVLMTVAR
ncbi:isoaspartyl peptidase/L-asparaginase, partial [Pedobacter antarcticus]|uniref:isoaspartyl peptidase/L-asparaginase n=1 Tax=Pedobacter antarcticus TaxID=34086 RepID=UPI00056570D3